MIMLNVTRHTLSMTVSFQTRGDQPAGETTILGAKNLTSYPDPTRTEQPD
jgi:hypothetical protein